MKFDIDYIAHNNKLSTTDAYIKILIAISLMIITLLLDNLVFDFLIFTVMAIGIIAIARISYIDFLKFISIPLFFALFSCIFLIFFFGTGEIIYNTGILGIVVREDAWQLGIHTFCRVFACFTCLGFLTLTTPISEIFHVLREIKVPVFLIEIALLMYTTIFIFLEQIDVMRKAQETRLGYFGTKNTYRSLGYLFTNLFIRSLDKSESLQHAMDSRAYNGTLPIYKPSKKS